jgi:hypothetical protein
MKEMICIFRFLRDIKVSFTFSNRTGFFHSHKSCREDQYEFSDQKLSSNPTDHLCDTVTGSTRMSSGTRLSFPNPAKEQTAISSGWCSICDRWIRIDLLYNFCVDEKIMTYLKKWS